MDKREETAQWVAKRKGLALSLLYSTLTSKSLIQDVKDCYEEADQILALILPKDRPALREILENFVEWDGRKIIPDNVDELYQQILALVYEGK